MHTEKLNNTKFEYTLQTVWDSRVICTISVRKSTLKTETQGSRMTAKAVMAWQGVIQDIVAGRVDPNTDEIYTKALTTVGFTDVTISRPELFAEEEVAE